MLDYWVVVALVAGAAFIGAWMERKDNNLRDAAVLFAVGAGGLAASATLAVT